MRILVVNDDGIEAQGIEILAREAAKLLPCRLQRHK